MNFFQEQIILNGEDQCVFFGPLVDTFGSGQPPAGQPELTGLVVGSQKNYYTMVRPILN